MGTFCCAIRDFPAPPIGVMSGVIPKPTRGVCVTALLVGVSSQRERERLGAEFEKRKKRFLKKNNYCRHYWNRSSLQQASHPSGCACGRAWHRWRRTTSRQRASHPTCCARTTWWRRRAHRAGSTATFSRAFSRPQPRHPSGASCCRCRKQQQQGQARGQSGPSPPSPSAFP